MMPFNGPSQVENCSNEGVIDETRDLREINDPTEALHGSDHDDEVGVNKELEREMEVVEGEIGGKSGNGSMKVAIDGIEGIDGLDWLRKAADILIGGAEGGAEEEIAKTAKELGLRLKDDVGDSGEGGASAFSEGTGLIRNPVDYGTLQGEADHCASPIGELVEPLLDKISVTDMGGIDLNESLPHTKDLGVCTKESGNQLKEVTQAMVNKKHLNDFNSFTGMKSNMVDLIVDLNTYYSTNGNCKHGTGVGIQGIEVNVASDNVRTVTEVNDASHLDCRALSGNQVIVIEEQMTDIGKRNDTKKKKVKLTASKSEFFVSNLVWGKVRSHPWWPGQIFDRSESSKKAMNYYKKDNFLVAYFGDGSFAWNEATRLKPFGAHFSYMEKQSNMESFRHAIDCALDEVSRRVEFGLACHCLPEELYANIKSQIVVNSGICIESRRRDPKEDYSSAAAFDAAKLVDFIKELAKCPYGVVNRLELAIAQAQLLSLYRWRGYPQLSEFKILGGLLDNDVSIPPSLKEKHHSDIIKVSNPDFKVEKQGTSGNKSKIQAGSSQKHNHGSGDTRSSGKKERSLSDLMAANHTYLLNENESENSVGNKLVSSFSGKKRKMVDTVSDDSVAKISRTPLSIGTAGKSPNSKQSFGVGDVVRRVASRLNGLTPNLKYSDAFSQKFRAKIEMKEKPATSEKSRRKKAGSMDWSSPDVMLSKLCLAAAKPREGLDFISSLVKFFSDFRNSVCLDHPDLGKKKQSLKEKSDRTTGEKTLKAETTKSSESNYVKDSYWTDRIIEGNPEDQLLIDSQDEVRDLLAVNSEAAPKLSPNMNSTDKTGTGNFEVESEKQVGDTDENLREEPPTALILNFTDANSVPSATNLSEIFSRYGPLDESESKVLNKTSRAKVVFKRRSDAETAFSSAGKYSVFGPSLVSYRLKYLPSKPQKSSSSATKRRRKNSITREGDAT